MQALHLPKDDPDPSERARQLEAAREIYRYSYEWPPGVAVAAEVPRSDSYSLRYIAELLPSAWAIFHNTLGMAELAVEHEALRGHLEAESIRVPALDPKSIGAWYLRIANEISSFVQSLAPDHVNGYGVIYRAMPEPEAWRLWDDDRTFTWQRIAGVNPMVLTRVRELPRDVAIGEREYARAMGGGSLAAALAEGRAFACDYRLLEGTPTGTTVGRAKHMPSPYALFVATGGELHPVAIQIGAPAGSAVHAPGDGNAWRVAKLAVQVADANHHETSSHLGRTHLVMEAVTLAMRRRLAERHPLHRLLEPHVEFTLPINHSAATNLIAKDGAVDRAFAGTIEASAALVKLALDGFDLHAAAPAVELAARGLDDAGVIRAHPYRDDALLVHAAISRFVERYVGIHYSSDADVADDVELAGFVEELGAPEGGRLRGVRSPRTIDELVSLVANIVWIASGQHAAVNFPQYPYMGVVPNMSGAMWGPWPPPDLGADDALLSLLPPYDMALLAVHTVYQLSSLRVNHLGKYGLFHFHGEARDAAKAFETELSEIEAVLRDRDERRYLPYPHLFPSNIPQSIHI